jgi:hypothetical protein
MFGQGGLTQRIQAVAYGAVGALPRALRAQAAAQYDSGNLARLTLVMTAWSRGTKLSTVEFAERFFGRAADDPIVETLHSAALDVGIAQSLGELHEAADKLAAAMQAIGVDRWPRFLADAQERASDPVTVAAVAKSQQPLDPKRDAIRPVYPVETALGIGAAGLAGGAAAAARAVGGAMLRQVLPGGCCPMTPLQALPSQVRALGRRRALSRMSATRRTPREIVSPFSFTRGSKGNTLKGPRISIRYGAHFRRTPMRFLGGFPAEVGRLGRRQLVSLARRKSLILAIR